jgi:hypothetical protein
MPAKPGTDNNSLSGFAEPLHTPAFGAAIAGAGDVGDEVVSRRGRRRDPDGFFVAQHGSVSST